MNADPQFIASLSPAFADALQNTRHALLTEDPVRSLARVLTQFHDEHRAEVLRDAAEICDEAASAYAERGADDPNHGANTAASALFSLMERFQRKADEAEYVAAPCDPMVPCEDGGEPCHVHERLMAHAEGEHELCEPDCGTKPAAGGVVSAAPDQADLPPLTEVWVVWRDEEPAYGYFTTEDAAKQATIDCWEEDEPKCPDYSWRRDGPRWELVVGGEHGDVYASRHRVYGPPVPPPTDRAAVLREVADWAYRIARRLDAQQRDERAQGAWDVENALRAELRRVADEAQQQDGTETREAPPVCEGFVWIGQSFATCDRCAQPAWEHAGEEVPAEGAGPFDNRRTVRPWKPGETDAIRAKWTPPAVSGPRAADDKQDGAQTWPCTCDHPADSHSVYGCEDDCGCEWMPKRKAPQ